MAHSGSSRDLLNLILGGGGAPASGARPAGSDGHATPAEDQHVPPISPSKPAAGAQHGSKSTPTGQEALEALFSTLRGSAPSNSNISPSAVSHAEKQSSSPYFQTSSGSPLQTRGRLASGNKTTSPPLDNAQGRNVLLSMLNLGSSPAQEARTPTPHVDADLPSNAPSQSQPNEHNATDALRSAVDGTNRAATPEDASDHAPSPEKSDSPPPAPPSEEDIFDAQPETSLNEAVALPDIENDNLGVTSQQVEAYVQEASSESSKDNEIPASPGILSPQSTHKTTMHDPQGIEARTTQPSVDNDIHEIEASHAPLHELVLQPGSTVATQAGDSYVLDRVPISRFTSSNQYTRGQQIAVNGLIAYGTRAGRVRIIDPNTGARLIKKLHNGLVGDMQMSTELPDSNGQLMRRLVTCHQNDMKVWQMPSSFDGDDAENAVIHEMSLPSGHIVEAVLFSPSDPNLVAFTVSNSPKIFVLDLSVEKRKANSPITLNPEALDRLMVLQLRSVSVHSLHIVKNNLADPKKQSAAAITWSTNGSVLAAISADGNLGFYDFESTQTFHTKLSTETDHIGQVNQIELLQTKAPGHPSALLVAACEGTVVDLYDLNNLHRPASRLRVCTDRMKDSPESDQTYARMCLVPGYQSLLLSVSSENTIQSVNFKLSEIDRVDGSVSNFEDWMKHMTSPRQKFGDTDGTQTSATQFIKSCAISTPNLVSQLVAAELNGIPGAFYLHGEGFEQIILDTGFLTRHDSPSPLAAADPVIPVADRSTSHRLPVDELLKTFDESLRIEQATLGTSDKPVRNEIQTEKSQGERQAVRSTHLQDDADIHGLFAMIQKELADQNHRFAQMLAAQQQMQEARFFQLSRELAAMRQEKVDPFDRVSQAIRTELRDNLLPVIATALAEIGQQTVASPPASLLATAVQHDQVIQRCTETMSDLFGSFSRQIGPAITEAISGTLERHLARLTIGQAEQSDTTEQIREILLAEQMKREQSNTHFETELQYIKAQLAHLQAEDQAGPSLRTTMPDEPVESLAETLSNGRSVKYKTKQDGDTKDIPASEGTNGVIARPATPSEAYEDMFLHALSQESDPLVRLVDAAPSSRLDRVLPYDGKPLITAPVLLTLCARLAKEFDNNKRTLEEQNGRVRLSWILASLRSSKWAKGHPGIAAYLPRIFTQVMHSLNARKQQLDNEEDVQILETALRMADELSGLW